MSGQGSSLGSAAVHTTMLVTGARPDGHPSSARDARMCSCPQPLRLCSWIRSTCKVPGSAVQVLRAPTSQSGVKAPTTS